MTSAHTTPHTNWAGNIAFSTDHIRRPSSLTHLQDLVAGSERVRVLGTGHSFNTIADTPGTLISLSDLPESITIDAERSSVTVDGGVRYARLAQRIHQSGFALPTMASLPHISVAGSCATGTHGSGDRHGNLATAVSAMQLVTANGSLVTLSRDDGEPFDGAVVNLGALGVVTALTLDVVPTYDVRQEVFDGLELSTFIEHLAEIFGSAHSVSAFTDWQASRMTQIWVKRRVDDDWDGGPAAFGAVAAQTPRHPVPGMPPGNCTQQLGEPGPWHERLPHFRAEFTPSNGDELQSEYLVPRGYAAEVITALNDIRERIAPVLQICELRTVAADSLWLSPCHQRDVLAMHFTWINDEPSVRAVLALMEDRLRPFGARPHWGKLFTMPPDEVRSLYPRLPDFRRLADEYDPDGVFSNDFVRTYVLS